MTRKQLFEMLAQAMHEAIPAVDSDARATQWRICRRTIADQLENHNSTFNRARFYDDCEDGPKQES